MSLTGLTGRDLDEVNRSASEAGKIVLRSFNPALIDRYMDPPANAAHPLDYSFHLLGDVRGKSVLDLGCGSGECVVPLAKRGASVIGIDISPDLIALARRRVHAAAVEATLLVRSAYETGLPDGSLDVVFCMSLIHHLEIRRVRDEMRRILCPGGCIILKEPTRFSSGYSALRSLLPTHDDVSKVEHPLTRAELARHDGGFHAAGIAVLPTAIRPALIAVRKRRSQSRCLGGLSMDAGARWESSGALCNIGGGKTANIALLSEPLLFKRRRHPEMVSVGRIDFSLDSGETRLQACS